MIKFENTRVWGFQGAFEGMRLPMASKGDSRMTDDGYEPGSKDLALALKLAQAGPDHGKYLRMIHIQTAITAPTYWIAEHDTYKVATTRNSSSFMHTGVKEGFAITKFDAGPELCLNEEQKDYDEVWMIVIHVLNELADRYRDTKDEAYFQAIRKLLPSGWLVTYEWDANYQILRNIYKQRKYHRLPEWHAFCEWVEGLPYSELITGEI